MHPDLPKPKSYDQSTIARLALLRYGFAIVLFMLAWRAQAQTPCPGADTCPGPEAQMVCPTPGTTLPGNDVTFLQIIDPAGTIFNRRYYQAFELP